jgi:hypothetical protein
MGEKTLENDQCLNIVGEELGIDVAISQNICKVLNEAVQSMVVDLPPEKSKDRVRRPMNAFMIYSRTARKAMAKHYPTLSYQKLSKALGKIWKVMGPEEKKPFIEEATRLRLLHRKEHPDFKFTSYKKQKPKGNVVKKSDKRCLTNVQDLLLLIQGAHYNLQLHQRNQIAIGSLLKRNEGKNFPNKNTE